MMTLMRGGVTVDPRHGSAGRTGMIANDEEGRVARGLHRRGRDRRDSRLVGHTTRWHPDSLFYEAQLLEVQGVEARLRSTVSFGAARRRRLRVVHDPEWVEYNRDFYRRRWVVPALGAAVEPVFGTDSLQLVSLIGYVLIGPVLFLLLRRRFGALVSAAAALICIGLPSLRFWAAQPLTDSFAVALEALGLLAAVLVLDRGRRWLPLWLAAVLLARLHP